MTVAIGAGSESARATSTHTVCGPPEQKSSAKMALLLVSEKETWVGSLRLHVYTNDKQYIQLARRMRVVS
jgi:hypothetical protein